MSHPFRKTIFVICLIVSMLCLVVGYGIAGKWIGIVIAIITGLAWLPARKFPDTGLPAICLGVSVCLAAVGCLISPSPLLMICGSGFALAVWDLVLLDHSLSHDSSEMPTNHYERKHLQSLALALGFGLLVTFLGRLFNLQFPFFILVLFVAFIIFGLDRTYGYIKNRKIHIKGE